MKALEIIKYVHKYKINNPKCKNGYYRLAKSGKVRLVKGIKGEKNSIYVEFNTSRGSIRIRYENI